MILKLTKYEYTIVYSEKTLEEIINDSDAVLVIAKGLDEIISDEEIRFNLMNYAKNDTLYLVIPDGYTDDKNALSVSKEIYTLDHNIINLLDKVDMELLSPIIWDRRKLK